MLQGRTQGFRQNTLVLVFLLILSMTGCCSAESHPHQGKVTPFQPGDPKVKLDKKALKILQSGKPYQTQILSEDGASGRGLVVQDVRAPTDVVWDRILDYNHYAQMVPKTIASQNYKVEDHRGGSQTIYTQMKVGFPMIKLTFYVKHQYEPKLHSLTWTLDYSKKSDFDDSCGYWYVVPHPDNPAEWTRVYYSVEVSMFDWVPQFVVNFMSSKALTDATGWVKKFSELEAEKLEPPVKQEVKQKRKGWLFRKQTTASTDDEMDTETCASSDDEECGETERTEPNKQSDSMGLSRYALVAYVFALSFYNVHLYLSR